MNRAIKTLALCATLLTTTTAWGQEDTSRGPGAAGGETYRIVQATDSPGIADLTDLGDAIGATGAAVPTNAIFLGAEAGGVLFGLSSGVGTAGNQVLRVTQSTDDAIALTAAADAAAVGTLYGQMMAGSDGANMRFLSTDAAGVLFVDTELPDAAALTDGDANPTAPGVGSYLMGWDNLGSVWSRVRQTGGRLQVDLDLVGGSQFGLGARAVASSISVTQDSTGGWTFDLAEVNGTTTADGAGTAAAGVQRTVQSQPNGTSVNTALAAANQADGISIAASATRANLLIQSSGTTACLVAIGAATGGTDGVILAGGTADDDGTGGLLTTTSTEAIYIYDLSGAGTCKYRSISEVW